jgi:hypothetical protein
MFQYIDADRVRGCSAEQFAKSPPYPWQSFEAFLKQGRFQELYRDFPSLDRFEFHQGLPKKGGARPHNRYYLGYEKTFFSRVERSGKGVIEHGDLAPSWQGFIEELSEAPEYRDFICRMLGVDEIEMGFAWHVGVTSSEVSPHVDARGKLGTHIFYFNTSEDWDDAWGGSLLVLGGKNTPAPNPEFADFETAQPVPLRDNRSFLFKNTPEAWHGVQALTCPGGSYRRLFNVRFHGKQTKASLVRRVTGFFSRSRTARGTADNYT